MLRNDLLDPIMWQSSEKSMKIIKLKYIFSSSHPIFKSDNQVRKPDDGESLFKLNNK